jgi:hypothetical protein
MASTARYLLVNKKITLVRNRDRQMDVRSDNAAIPLAVDLDGTLIATDLLWEGLFLLLRQQPLALFLVPFWLLQGPARLKLEIARRVSRQSASLPYRQDLVVRLQQAAAAGRS